MRIDLYTSIHKAQRFHLFQLSHEIGAADFGSPDDIAKISGLLRNSIDHLRDHAKNEEHYIHPLFRQLGAKTAQELEREHHELESELENLERILSERRWDELYGQYTRFLGIYLVHLSEEEAAQKETLWRHYDDQALMEVFSRFKTERSPQAGKADLKYMLPALNNAELTRMYLGMKASAPGQVFQGACDLAAQVLEAGRWRQLSERIQLG